MNTIYTPAPPHPSPSAVRQKRRLILAVAVWAAGWFLGLTLIPVVNAAAIDVALKSTLNAILLLGLPKLFLILAIAILGKAGFDYLKFLFGLEFRQLAPPGTVGAGRYRAGLLLLIAVLVLSSIGEFLVASLIPMRHEHPRLVALAGDLLILVSLLLLGGDFWDKLRSLFFPGAKAVFPQPNYRA